jgi:hypothetical protein
MSTKTRPTRPHFHLPTHHGHVTRTLPSPTVPSGTPPTRRDQQPRLLYLLIPILVAILGVAILWFAVDQGTQTEAPPTPGVSQFDSEVPATIDGSDWHLYLRAQEQAANKAALMEWVYGSDRNLYNLASTPEVVDNGSDQRLYNRAAEITAEQQAPEEWIYGSDRYLY